MFATLDGRLTENETGRKGILEIKTTSIVQSMQKEKWWKDGGPRLPDQYYVQLLWQLLVTGFEFAVLHAQLKYNYGDDIRTERRSYHIERSEVVEDIEYLETAAVKFWRENVEKGIKPNLILPEL